MGFGSLPSMPSTVYWSITGAASPVNGMGDGHLRSHVMENLDPAVQELALPARVEAQKALSAQRSADPIGQSLPPASSITARMACAREAGESNGILFNHCRI